MVKAGKWKYSEVLSVWTMSIDKCKHKQRDETEADSNGTETPQARCYCSWTAKGIKRYNQLFAESNK